MIWLCAAALSLIIELTMLPSEYNNSGQILIIACFRSILKILILSRM